MDKANATMNSILLGSGGASSDGPSSPPETIELLNELTKQVFTKEDVETRTDLKDTQLLRFSVVRAYANEFDIPVINDILEMYSIYAISKGRKSREEFTKLASSITGYSVEAEGRVKSIPDNLLGRS